MATLIEKEEKKMRKQYHTLAHKLGMTTEDRKAFLMRGWKKESSADMNAHELIDVINSLEAALKEQNSSSKLWDARRYAYGAIGGYLAAMYPGQSFSKEYIKNMGSRSAGGKAWDTLAVCELTAISGMFNRMKTAAMGAKKVAMEQQLTTNYMNLN